MAESNREKTDSSTSPARTQPMKCPGCCLPQPSQLPFPLDKAFSLAVWRLACSSPWLQTPNCNSLLFLNKLIIAGEISGSLFILGQHFGDPYGDQRRPPKALGLLNRCGTHNWAHCRSLLSCWPWSLKVRLSPRSKLMPSLCLKLSRFYSESFLRFRLSG